MRLCLGMDAESGASLQEQADAAVGAGFRCLDLWAPTLDAYLANYPSVLLASVLRERGLYVAMVSGLPSLPIVEDTALQTGQGESLPAREAFLLYQARILALCADLDALGGGTVLVPVVQAQAFEGSPFPSPVERALRILANLAAPFEARLAVIQPLKGNSEGTIEDVAALVERVQRPNLGLGLDLSEGTIPASIPAATAGRLWAVRLGTTAWREDERSRLRALCAGLAAAGFSGPCSLTLLPGRDPIETPRVFPNP
jgi:sugar phosphate isomerase/epimerase